MVPVTITQAEAPTGPKGLCISPVQARGSLMCTVSAAGWPSSEGTAVETFPLKMSMTVLTSNRIQAPSSHRVCVGVGVERGRETGWHCTHTEHGPIHKVTTERTGPQSSWGCTVVLSYQETNLWRKDGVPRKISNMAEVRTPSMSYMGREKRVVEKDHWELSFDSARLH